jgi:hypothetical protein
MLIHKLGIYISGLSEIPDIRLLKFLYSKSEVAAHSEEHVHR